jgi:hypothetical protein
LGIGIGVVDVLIQLRAAGHLRSGSAIAELGAQQLASSYFQHPDRVALLRQLILQPLPTTVKIPPPIKHPTDILDDTAPSAEEFWRSIGFEYAAIDIDGSPGSIAIDLNYDGVPPQFKGKFDVVTNFGTTEHLANQLNAFRVMHDLTAHKGIMIHLVPIQGYLNHGLINYNFKFFWMLARSNGYRFIETDFSPETNYSELPDNIQNFLNQVNLSSRERSYNWTAANAGMLAVLRKEFNIDFVAPIDVNTGATTSNETLKKRYWTVFQPRAFEQLEAGDPTEGAATKAAPPRPATKGGASSGVTVSSDHQHTVSTDHQDAGAESKSFQLRAHECKDNRSDRGFARRAFSAIRTRGLSGVTHLFRRFRQRRSLAHGIASQSDLLNRKFDALIAGIANQSDLINRKFEALTKAISELGEIQKAQLMMQRSAAEEIRKVAAAERQGHPDRSSGKEAV